MRVLQLSWEYPPVIEGGLGRHMKKLCEGLAAHGVEVHVLTRASPALPAEEVRRGVTVHRVSAPEFPRGDVDAFLRWVAEMNAQMRERAAALRERFAFDLVHSHDWLVAGAAAPTARAAGIPWVTTIHATEFGRHQGWVKRRPQSTIHAAEGRMARGADRIITCSDFMRGHVRSVFRVPARRITTIPNGVDPGDLDPGGIDLAALRSLYAEPDEQLVLLVGRLVYEKGFHLALDALAPLLRRRTGRRIRFVVAGTGTAETELKAQARALRISRRGTFLGWTGDDRLHALYRIADLVIVPSIYEPFGIVALEAMASGCLTVVADTGGLREVVPGDGTVGLRFPVKDAAALRQTVERILADDAARAQIVAEAREHVLRFDWSEVARRTAGEYAALVAGSRAAVG